MSGPISQGAKYDARPATHAAENLADDLAEGVKKERNRRLLAVAERVQRARLERYAGTSVRAFVESVSERDARILLGRTVHGVPVSFPGEEDFVGRTVELTIDETTAYGMAGRALEPAGR